MSSGRGVNKNGIVKVICIIQKDSFYSLLTGRVIQRVAGQGQAVTVHNYSSLLGARQH